MNFRQLCHRSAKTAFTTFSLDDAEEVGSRGGGGFHRNFRKQLKMQPVFVFRCRAKFSAFADTKFWSQDWRVEHIPSLFDFWGWCWAMGRCTSWSKDFSVDAMACCIKHCHTHLLFLHTSILSFFSPQASSPQTQKNSITFLGKYNMERHIRKDYSI